MKVRLIVFLSGVLAVIVAGPLGNSASLFCEVALRGFCDLSPYRSGFSPDRILGFLLLGTGIGLAAWSLGASGKGPQTSSKPGRLLFALRWAPLPAGALAVLVFVLARTPGPALVIAVDLVNVPEDQRLNVTVNDERQPTTPSWYRRSWDHLFGLPTDGYHLARAESDERRSSLRVRGSAFSFEHWRRARTTLTASVGPPTSGGFTELALSPEASAPTEHHVKVADGLPCPNRDGSETYCYTKRVPYPEHASQLRVTLDFARLR